MPLLLKGTPFACADCRSKVWEIFCDLVPSVNGLRASFVQIICAGCGLVHKIEGGMTAAPERETPPPKTRIILPTKSRSKR